MIKITTASGKVIKMDLASAYNDGGINAAMAICEIAKMAMGNDKAISCEYVKD